MLIKSKNLLNSNIIGLISVYSSSNNTIINVSNIQFKTLLSGSTGMLGLKGSSKSTFYAGQSVGNVFSKKLLAMGIKYVLIKIKGFSFNRSRYSSIEGISMAGLKILSIQDVTPTPFNGCRLSKKRRI